MRIAVAQLSLESNSFAAGRCRIDHFLATGYLLEGEALRTLACRDNEVAGMLTALETAHDVEVVPLLAARGNSSGMVAAEDFARLADGILARLREAGRIDGLLLSCHGAMAAEGEDDPEGWLLERVRAIIGERVPIALTVDLHGNVTARMARCADLIVAYETYPHVDATSTGRRAAELLLRQVRGEIHPVLAHAKLPLLLTAFHGSTTAGPFAELMRAAKALEGHDGVLSVSLSFVGAYLDAAELGCSVVVIADGEAEIAERRCRELAEAFWAARERFVVESVSVGEALRRARAIDGGPVLLLDTADTTGGGAAGDSIAAVRGLLAAGLSEIGLATVVDAAAAEACHRAGLGAHIELAVGHRGYPRWGEPLMLSGTVARLHDGRFRYRGGILGGCEASMGPTAVLRVGTLSLLIASHPTYEFATEQPEAVGLDPRAAKLVVVKNMMNFRVAYAGAMTGHFVLDCPGPTPADLRALPFARVPRPTFPLDPITEARPMITTRAAQRPGYFQRIGAGTRTEFWINNPTPEEAASALAMGAVGATTNPTYCARLLKESPGFRADLARLASGGADADTVMQWAYAGAIARLQAIFAPLHRASRGRHGYVAVQGDPRHDGDAGAIVAEAMRLRRLGENIMVKVPATVVGASALVELTERGIPTIATLGFSVDQALALADARQRASAPAEPPPCYITLIAGILDEQLAREAQSLGIPVPSEALRLAGVACTRVAYLLFQEHGYAARLMGGGARGPHHFTELVGGDLAVTIGHPIAQQLVSSDPATQRRIDAAIPQDALDALMLLPSFRRAITAGALASHEFNGFAPVAAFRRTFLDGYDTVLAAIAGERPQARSHAARG